MKVGKTIYAKFYKKEKCSKCPSYENGRCYNTLHWPYLFDEKEGSV